MVEVIPLISKDGQHTPAPDGSVLDPSLIPLSADADNALTRGSDDGLFVPAPDPLDPADLISATEGNRLETGLDGKLTVPAPDPVNPADLISTDRDNQLVTGSDGRLTVPAPDRVDPSDFISTDPGNAIFEGQDLKLFARAVSVDSNNLVQRGSDFGAKLTGSDLVSAGSTGNLLKVSAVDGRLEVDRDTVVAEVSHNVKIVSDDADNLLRSGSDGGAFLNEARLPDQVKSGVATAVTDGRVDVLYGTGLKVQGNALQVDQDALELFSVSATDAILKMNAKTLTASVSAAYDVATGYLTLYGRDNIVLNTVYIPGSGSALQDVTVVKNPAGEEPGTYFKYTFITTAGVRVVYVSVPEGQTVTEGNGVSVTVADSVAKVSVRLKPSDSGLLLDASGISVDFSVLAKKDDLDALTSTVESVGSGVAALAENLNQLEDDVSDLQDKVDALETASSISISTTEPDVSGMAAGTGVLFPASALLL